MDPIQVLLEYIAKILAVVFVLTLHEFAHAFVAYKCGDPTPKWNKRLTLNPLRHFDIVGLVCFVLVGFGWAKPVPVNPNNYKHYRRDSVFVSAAGIVVNYLTAFLFYPLAIVVFNHLPVGYFKDFLYDVTYMTFAFSLSFCVFNLLPLYPLDGFRLVEALSKKHGKIYRFLRQYGYIILLGLIVESFICDIFVNRLGVYQMAWFDLLGYIMRFATDIFGWPISALWGAIFRGIYA